MLTTIGIVSRQIILKWLRGHGVAVTQSLKMDGELCDLFFEIHAKNPITWKKGTAVSRKIIDAGEEVQKILGRRKKATFVDVLALKKTTVQERISSTYKNLEAQDISIWQSSPFFINMYHERLFAHTWPTLHKVLCTGRAGSPNNFKAEKIMATRFKNTNDLFKKLGLL